MVGPGAHLADGAAVPGHLDVAVTEHPHVGAEDRDARRGPLGGRPGRARLGQAAGEGGRRLGHAVAADDRAPERRLELLEQRRARRRAAHRDLPHAGDVAVVDRDGWSSTSRAMAGTRNRRVTRWRLHQPQDLPGLEAGEQHVDAAEPGDVVRGAPAVHVEQRDRVQHDVLAGQAHGEGAVHGVQVEAAVAEHRSLGQPGGARGVEDLGRRPLVDRWRVGRPGGLSSEEGLVVVTEAHRAHAVAGVDLVGVAEEHDGAAVVEDRAQLRGRQAHVQRQEDGPGQQHAEVGLEQLVGVAAQPGHHLARTHRRARLGGRGRGGRSARRTRHRSSSRPPRPPPPVPGRGAGRGPGGRGG